MKKSSDWDYTVYIKECTDKESWLKIYDDRDVIMLEEHSKKPAVVRDRIVQLCGDLPRIELFARQYADGWDCWGNEV